MCRDISASTSVQIGGCWPAGPAQWKFGGFRTAWSSFGDGVWVLPRAREDLFCSRDSEEQETRHSVTGVRCARTTALRAPVGAMNVKLMFLVWMKWMVTFHKTNNKKRRFYLVYFTKLIKQKTDRAQGLLWQNSCYNEVFCCTVNSIIKKNQLWSA